MPASLMPCCLEQRTAPFLRGCKLQVGSGGLHHTLTTVVPGPAASITSTASHLSDRCASSTLPLCSHSTQALPNPHPSAPTPTWRRCPRRRPGRPPQVRRLYATHTSTPPPQPCPRRPGGSPGRNHRPHRAGQHARPNACISIRPGDSPRPASRHGAFVVDRVQQSINACRALPWHGRGTCRPTRLARTMLRLWATVTLTPTIAHLCGALESCPI